ncbi:MAG: hypothetical protein ACE37F_00825 [Nannocystaceae bacterium]|nr:hypothetical protein [bacterium]
MADVHELLAKYRTDKKAATAQLALAPSFGVGAYQRQPGGRVWAPSRAAAPKPRPAPRQAQQTWRSPAPAYNYGYPPRGGYVGEASANGTQQQPAPPPTPPTSDPYYPNGNPIDPQNPPGSGQYPQGYPNGVPCYPPPQPPPRDCDPCGHGVTMHCETPTPCGSSVIGQTTFGTEGIQPGQVLPLSITAGDAKTFKPTRLFFEAFPWAGPELIDIGRMPPGATSLPVFMVDAFVGRQSQIRRGGSTSMSISQSAYANSKPIEVVDWQEFTSTNEHTLAIHLLNPNKDIPIHASVTLWGDI